MATIFEQRPTKLADERRFFFWMSIAIFVTVVAGFGTDIVAGRAWFTEFPWQVHVHAVVFSAWITLYVVQNWLVADGRNVALHRRLGWLGAGIAALMVPLGIAAVMMAVARGGTPPFFPPGIFLSLDILGILGFGALTFAAIRMRNNAGWHKRLMLCGTALVMSPALGRILPMPLLGSLAPFAVFASLMLYILAGIGFDLVNRGRVHPAYWWGACTVALMQLLVGPIGLSPPVQALAQRLMA